MADTGIAYRGTVTRLGQCLKRCRVFVVILGLSAASVAVPADAQTSFDRERVERARRFLNRFLDSPCLYNEKCQSWLGENKRDVNEVYSALGEADRILGDIGRLEAAVGSLERVRRQAEHEAQAMQQRLNSLTRDAVDKALGVLAQHHFGFEADSPASLLSRQMREGASRLQCGDQQIIITIFGYFTHDHEIDLTQGGKTFKLVFQPFPFASGGSLGQAIDQYTAKAHLSLEPRLEVVTQSIAVTPTIQRQEPLDPVRAIEWRWDLKQSAWSSVKETDGAVAVRVTSPQGARDAASLKVKLKGKPWWWPFTWIWENVLSNVQLWAPAAVVAVIAWRQGVVAAGHWLWEWVKRKGGDGNASPPKGR